MPQPVLPKLIYPVRTLLNSFSPQPFRYLLLLFWFIILTLPSCAIEFRGAITLERCAIRVGDTQFMAEMARTAAQRQQGLMGRDSLNDGEGMLFVFPHSQMVSFWMKDTYIPLTVGYFNTSGILVELHDLVPRSLRSVPSSQPIRYALELGRGEFQRHHIALGDQLMIDCPSAPAP